MTVKGRVGAGAAGLAVLGVAALTVLAAPAPGALPPIQARDQYLSTSRRQAGILMDVHSVLLCKLLSFQTSASQGWTE